MGKYRTSGNLIIANQTFHIDAPIVNFTEPPYWNATQTICIPTENDPAPACTPGTGGMVPYGKLPVPYTQRYTSRPALRRYGANPPLEAVKSAIRQFVVHHDGCNSSDMAFAVMQNERGLSCHFLIDNDGTIFQTIDLALAAYHAAEWNFGSIGVEMCNRGDVALDKNYYASGKHGPTRKDVACRINGHTFLAWEFTAAQMTSFQQLARGLQRYLPNIPAEYPQSSPGVQHWGTLPQRDSFAFSGYIGHYHLTGQKWDPGPFDFKEFCSKLRGSFCFPVFPRGEPKKLQDKPEVPTQSDELKDDTALLFKANEAKAEGGFFPVGPWGESRLWHGGVHVTAKAGAPVFAPFPGRLVVARMGANSPVGSVNFVLLRHDMALGTSKVQFYSLYMHLADELAASPAGGKPVDWISKPEGSWKKANGKAGTVVLLDEPIEAGTLIGHVGSAGPADRAKAQLHLEFFSNSELFVGVPGSPWEVIDGTAGGRFCDSPRVNDLLDTDKDGTLSHQELSSFYEGGGSSQVRNLVTFHVSEWTAEPSWADALRAPKDFKKYTPAQIDEIVAEQITPGLWWDAAVAKHARIAPNGEVYHYNPVAFLGWFNQQLLDAKEGPAADKNDAQGIPKDMLGDLGANSDTTGASMRSGADSTEDPCNKQLGLHELSLGFDAPECTPQ